jgi:hypothetical protein
MAQYVKNLLQPPLIDISSAVTNPWQCPWICQHFYSCVIQ